MYLILQIIIIILQLFIIIKLINYRSSLMEKITQEVEPIEEDNKSKVRDFKTPRGLYTNRPYNKG